MGERDYTLWQRSNGDWYGRSKGGERKPFSLATKDRKLAELRLKKKHGQTEMPEQSLEHYEMAKAHQLSGTSGGAANTFDEIEIRRHTGQISGNVLKFPYRMRVDCGGVTTRSDWAWMSFDVAAMASRASLSVYDGSCATNYNVTRCVGGAAYVVSDTGNNYPNSGDVVMYQDGGGTYRCATVGTESLYAANDGDIDMAGFSNCSDCQMYSGE